MRNLAADLVEGRDGGWDQMAAIRDEFVNTGFYDATPDTPPGHSYGRIATMLTDPTRIVGFEEQYAAAAAVMAEVAGLPVRVVVGYEVSPDAWRDGKVDVTANDISAWVELDAGELGWVPVDVTPDRSRTPDPEAQGATTQQVAIPNPPPPPPPPPDVEPPRQEERKIDESKIDPITHTWGDGAGWPVWAVVTTTADRAAAPARCWRSSPWSSGGRRCGGAAGGPARRRPVASPARGPRRSTAARRPARRASTDVTPHERIGVYVGDAELTDVEPDLRRLAAQVDRAAYAADAPGDEHAAEAWRCSDEVAAELLRRQGVGRRLKMHLDPRPLRRDHADERRPTRPVANDERRRAAGPISTPTTTSPCPATTSCWPSCAGVLPAPGDDGRRGRRRHDRRRRRRGRRRSARRRRPTSLRMRRRPSHCRWARCHPRCRGTRPQEGRPPTWRWTRPRENRPPSCRRRRGIRPPENRPPSCRRRLGRPPTAAGSRRAACRWPSAGPPGRAARRAPRAAVDPDRHGRRRAGHRRRRDRAHARWR